MTVLFPRADERFLGPFAGSAGGRDSCRCRRDAASVAAASAIRWTRPPRVPDFFTFRAQLQTALARRDVAALLAVVHPDIKNGFGGDDGKANFEVKWRPAAADSEVWATLTEVLALGGTLASRPDTFVAPYVFSRWPEGVDGFGYVAVVGDRVRIRRRPSQDAAEVGSSSFRSCCSRSMFVTPASRGRRYAWPTGLPDTSHRDTSAARSAIARLLEGRRRFWQMTMLLAGD